MEQVKQQQREANSVPTRSRPPGQGNEAYKTSKNRRSFEGVTTPSTGVSAVDHRRPPSVSGPDAASTPQPRPHSDLIPGVTDDRYVAAWRKRGPVTLLSVSPSAATTTIVESSDDNVVGAVKRRSTTAKPPNPKLQQTIQEVLTESSNDSTDEFLGADSSRTQHSLQLDHKQQHQQQHPPPPVRSASLQQHQHKPLSPPPSYSPGQVSIAFRKSDHLHLDESGESETDHVIPTLSV